MKIRRSKRCGSDRNNKHSYLDERCGIGKLKQGIESLSNVKKVLYAPKQEKVNRMLIGPGIYFPSGFVMGGHVPVIIVGDENKGYGERASVFPCGSAYELLKEIIAFRLDGYGSGAVSRDCNTMCLIEALEELDEVAGLKVGMVERRTEEWKGPGFYNIKPQKRAMQLTALACGSKKPGAGLKVCIYPDRNSFDELEYTVRNYWRESGGSKKSTGYVLPKAAYLQYGNAIDL